MCKLAGLNRRCQEPAATRLACVGTAQVGADFRSILMLLPKYGFSFLALTAIDSRSSLKCGLSSI